MSILGEVNKEIARLWVDALRSGKYEQTHGVLHDDKGFCCLGVLCDVAVGQGVIPPPVSGPFTEYRKYGLDGRESFPPIEVTNWLGNLGWTVDLQPALRDKLSTKYDEPGIPRSMELVYLNDGTDATFSDIADAIEYTYLREDDVA